MNRAELKIAESVISRVSRQTPADAVLQTELRRHRDDARVSTRRISRAVFAFYRWQSWLDEGEPLPRRIEAAWQLQELYHQTPETFSDDELLTKAVPGWVAAQMEASTPAWVRSIQREPRVWLRARKGQGLALMEKLGNCRVAGDGVWADTLEYLGSEDLFLTEPFRAGEFELQDIGSQWVGLLCAPRRGEIWWDACAGGGGKLLQLSALMDNKGLIWASDRAEWRLQKLKRRAARARAFNYRQAVWEGGEELPTETRFDGVLLDAPCSGIGTWHRNPHARWTCTPADVTELAELQGRLLTHAARAVKPEGKLVYSVCTLTRAETWEVADRFERQMPEFQPLPLSNPFRAEDPAATRLWTWPQDQGGNGMFVAAWRKARAT